MISTITKSFLLPNYLTTITELVVQARLVLLKTMYAV